jgi:hypothetical protein
MAKVTRQTVRGALLGFVVTVNDLLRGRDSPADVLQLSAAEITGAVMDRTKGLDDRLDVATDEEMLDRAMEFILEWASGSHGIPIVLPNEQELTLSSVEKALINCALAPCDMDMTPRQFLRQPKTLEFLKEILVVFAKACIDPELEAADDAETEAEAERFCWEEAAGIILGDPEMLRMYNRSTGAQKDQQGFTVLVRKALINFEGEVTKESLRSILAHAEHEMAMKSEGALSRGGSA